MVDKVVLFYAPKLLGGADGVPLFAGRGFPTLGDAPSVRITDLRRIGDDFVVEGYLRPVYDED
jgi:diaminohydroxyphosphoribosylaminopyrimidine deaminase/5-amino-6-(5-phosphoribosylamino)uracil reductase